jgi:hypothetical protein
VHWHGIALRNNMDGVPVITQAQVAAGRDFTYRFTAADPGTYWYHPHVGVQLPGWRRGRPMFAYADGRPVRPEYLTHRFSTLVKEFDLPPIRVHDLRHGAATLALASRTDLKVIQQMLGHSSIVTTADTYTSFLPETAHRAAQATADMVIKAARSAPGSRLSGTAVPHVPAATARCEFPQLKRPSRKRSRMNCAAPCQEAGSPRVTQNAPSMPHNDKSRFPCITTCCSRYCDCSVFGESGHGPSRRRVGCRRRPPTWGNRKEEFAMSPR